MEVPEKARKEVEKAVYLFGFARRGRVASIEGPGVEAGEPVLQWPVQDVVALVSWFRLEGFTGPGAEARLRDLAWVGPRACLHEAVLEQAMGRSPVFPARFGTLFSTRPSLERLVKRNYAIINGFLDYVSQKKEWGVKGLLDREEAMAHCFNRNTRLAKGASSPGTRYLLDRKHRAKSEQEVAFRVREVEMEVAEALQPHAGDVRSLKVLSRQASGRDLDIVFNRAFLLSEMEQEGFQQTVEQLNAEYQAWGLALELSGPWPPYNFCPSLEPTDETGIVL